MQFSNTVTIRRSAAEVFAFLSDFENPPLWNYDYAIGQTRRSGTGPVGVGTRYTQIRTVPRRAVETFEVTDHEPEQLVAIRGTLGPFRATSSYRLETAGAATVLTSSMTLEPAGGLRLVASLAAPRVQKAVAENLQALKHLLEEDSSRSTA
jgi:carbon monoxide dehydrogenase subunit G